MSLFVTPDLKDAGKRFPGAVATLGTFDGVHLGHQAILSEVLLRAKAGGKGGIVLTFSPHPQEVVSPQNAPLLLTSPDEKTARIGELGLDALVFLPFDQEMADLSPEAFIREYLWPRLGMNIMVLGQDSKFGKGRKGDVALLTRLGGELGFKIVSISPVLDGGRAISSTRIRQLLSAGKVREAAKLLGRPYTLTGKVGQGGGRGRSLGYPTANLAILGERRQMVKEGVYAIKVNYKSQWHNGLMNIGVRPTFNETALEHEVHLFDFSGELYGEVLEVAFIDRLRDEKAFPDVPSLLAQIRLDEGQARKILTS
jgi:riboflavin kinase/FMN adenylyltransferase